MKRIILAGVLFITACSSTPTQTPVEPERPPLPNIVIQPPTNLGNYTAEQGIQALDSLSKCYMVYEMYAFHAKEKGLAQDYEQAVIRMELFGDAMAALYGTSYYSEDGYRLARNLATLQREGIIQTYKLRYAYGRTTTKLPVVIASLRTVLSTPVPKV